MSKIPKIIHYCWFGKNPLPSEYKKYIESWKKFCPDYEIKEWNEDNFDINSNIYMKEAYEAKKWAFVTDYVRLYVLYKYGGIYMDADVEVIKPLDEFLKHEAFSGFETKTDIPTGIMACRKGNKLFKELLDYYNNRHFKLDSGEYDTTTNVITITKICEKYGLVKNNKYQVINGFALYPKEYFCPKNIKTGVIDKTDNTYTIHHFSGSWMPQEQQKRRNLKRRLIKKYKLVLGNIIYYTIYLPYVSLSIIKERISK